MRQLTILFAVLIVAPLAACGGSGGEPSNGADATANTATETNQADQADAKGADGTITATLNGEQRTWYIVRKEMGGEMHSQSESASWANSGRVITLFGHTSANSMAATDGLMLELNLVVMENTATVSSADIKYLRGEDRDMYVTRGPVTDGIDLASHKQEGDKVTVSGTFEATLEQNASEKKEGPATIAIKNGQFNATVYKAPEK